MKATGIVRKVDELGRIVLPAELRRTLSIAEKDPLEIYVDGGSIILQKHEERCVFCGGSEDLRTVLGKNICGSCLSRLRKCAHKKTEESFRSSGGRTKKKFLVRPLIFSCGRVRCGSHLSACNTAS